VTAELSASEWDDRWVDVFEQARADGVRELDAAVLADEQTCLQLGPRPEGRS
jgi:hypothetical protein